MTKESLTVENTPPEVSRRAYQIIAEDLAAQIGEKYDIGDKLPPERELAKHYLVSRPTVREALLALSINGMVEIRSKGGVFVTGRKPVEELASSGIGPFETIDARLLIEPEIAAMAAAKADPALLERLQGCIELMLLEHKNNKEADEGDHGFHVALAEATGNGMLMAVCDLLWKAQLHSPLWSSIHERMKMKKYWPMWIEDHQNILMAIRLGSPIQSRLAMIRHLENIRHALLANSGSGKIK